jgi:hypothetical protein
LKGEEADNLAIAGQTIWLLINYYYYNRVVKGYSGKNRPKLTNEFGEALMVQWDYPA